jgi:fatty-acyl-CoA synthase
MFLGYFDNPQANQQKYRDGVYHSGDLGHVLVRDGKRYLFFDGRTDDWIRKDGANFSALQVARLLQEHPDVVLAAAYGVPCAVGDELVMVALKLGSGRSFDPQSFFDFCEQQVVHGGMDRKWFPDFVRLVEEFEYTQTEKILVRNLKRTHFDRRRLADAPLYWRRRGDTTYQPFTAPDYERLRQEFGRVERLDLLDR